MRIALVFDAVYPWSVGGGELHVHELGECLAARGHEVHLVGMQWWDGASVRNHGKIMLHGLVPVRALYANEAKRSITPPLKFAAACARFFAQERFDIVDCCAMPYLPALAIAPVMRIRQMPMVLTWFEVWGSYWRSYLGWLGFIGQMMERTTAHIGQAHIAISPLTAERIRILNRNTTVHMVPSGVDVPKVEYRPEAGRIGWFGRALAHKNLPLLLDALAMLPDLSWSLVVISDGPALQGWKAHARGLGIDERIQWLGTIPDRSALFAELARCEIVVQTSLREGQGKAALEAVLLGLPLVCVRHPDVATTGFLMHGTSAWMIDSLNAEALSGALGMLSSNLALRKQLSQGGRALAENLSWNRTASHFESVYRQVLDTVRR